MSELVAAMERKSKAITAARAEADALHSGDPVKADKKFKKLCTAINRDFKQVKRAHEAAAEEDDPKEKTQKQEDRAAVDWPDKDGWQDAYTSEKNMKDTRKELNEWCGGLEKMITAPAGLHGGNLHNSKHADKTGTLFWLQSQNLQGDGPVTIKIPKDQELDDILPGGWEKVRHSLRIRCAFAAHSLHSLHICCPLSCHSTKCCILMHSVHIHMHSHCICIALCCMRLRLHSLHTLHILFHDNAFDPHSQVEEEGPPPPPPNGARAAWVKDLAEHVVGGGEP